MSQINPPPFPPNDPPRLPEKNAWQFSLRTMMLGMTGFALLCGLLSSFPIINGILLGGFWLVLSGFLLTGIVFARNDQRAFCIGSSVAIASSWTGLGGMFLESAQSLAYSIGFPVAGWPGIWLKHVVLFTAAIANGYLCIRARHYFEQHANDLSNR